MKIAIAIYDLNIKGGTQKQVLRLCQYLAKNNIEFVLVTINYQKDMTYTEFQDFKIISFNEIRRTYTKNRKCGIIRKIFLYTKILCNLVPKDVDIVNIHDNGLFVLGWLSKIHKKIVIWQINDFPPEFGVGVSKNNDISFKEKIKAILIKFLTKKFDAITVNVSKNKKRVKHILGKNAKVFYCGVDINDNLQIHNFCDEHKVFNLLSMGVFFPYRNYETLVTVVKKMQTEGIPIRLDIIGSIERDVSYSDKIKCMINESKLNESIKIWGQVDEQTYVDLFDRANAFAFVNIDQSWGLAVFEAMSCGLPTIVSNSVGATELLHNEVDSIIVEPTDVNGICDKLEILMNDKNYYNFISQNGINAARSYTWDNMYCSKMLDVFKELGGFKK